LRFASLGSGSRGNATLIEAGATRLLVDCGFSCVEVEKRLARLGCEAAQLDAILVTHEHSDHIGGVERLARKYGLGAWMTPGTAAAGRIGEPALVRHFSSHETFAIGDVEIQPLPVPHDAREPCQFVFSDGRCRTGLLTDVGSITSHMLRSLQALDALVLECNHDPQMLADGPYPPRLKARVGGDYGHLSNEQAAGLLGRLDQGRLQHLVAAHLSEKNNRPALVREALAPVLGCRGDDFDVADQALGFGWREVR